MFIDGLKDEDDQSMSNGSESPVSRSNSASCSPIPTPAQIASSLNNIVPPMLSNRIEPQSTYPLLLPKVLPFHPNVSLPTPFMSRPLDLTPRSTNFSFNIGPPPPISITSGVSTSSINSSGVQTPLVSSALSSLQSSVLTPPSFNPLNLPVAPPMKGKKGYNVPYQAVETGH